MKSPFMITFASSFILGGLVYLRFWFPNRGATYNMDPLEEKGAFEPHLKRYQDLAKLILTLSTASIAFIVHFLVSPRTNADGNIYSSRLVEAVPWALGFLCASVIATILFLLIISYFYEEYTHFNYLEGEGDEWDRLRARGQYHAWKSSLVWSFAFTALISFCSAYEVLAIMLLA